MKKEEIKLSQSTSPTPKPKEEARGVKFGEAALMAVAGKKIHRLSWPEDEHGFLLDGIMSIHKNGRNYNWLITDGDITGDDYVLWGEKQN